MVRGWATIDSNNQANASGHDVILFRNVRRLDPRSPGSSTRRLRRRVLRAHDRPRPRPARPDARCPQPRPGRPDAMAQARSGRIRLGRRPDLDRTPQGAVQVRAGRANVARSGRSRTGDRRKRRRAQGAAVRGRRGGRPLLGDRRRRLGPGRAFRRDRRRPRPRHGPASRLERRGLRPGRSHPSLPGFGRDVPNTPGRLGPRRPRPPDFRQGSDGRPRRLRAGPGLPPRARCGPPPAARSSSARRAISPRSPRPSIARSR